MQEKRNAKKEALQTDSFMVKSITDQMTGDPNKFVYKAKKAKKEKIILENNRV